MSNHLKSNYSDMIVLDVTPESANWEHLSFRVIRLQGEQVYLHQTQDTELALVPLEGSGVVQTEAGDFPLQRAGVFQEKPSVLYVPPGQEFGVIAQGSFEFAIGAAPAEGKYPRVCSLRTRLSQRCAAVARRGVKSITPWRILCRPNG